MESSFIIWEGNKSIWEHIWLSAAALSQHIHSSLQHTHTQDTKHHKQALHETFDRYKVIRSTIKLHTVHHTTEDLSQRMAFTWERKFQRTLAVKQPGVSRVLRWEEAAPENTDFMIFNVTERSCSVPDQWLLRTVPQGKRGETLLSFVSKREILSQRVQSQDCSFSRRSDGKQMCRSWQCSTKYLGHMFEMNKWESERLPYI